MKIVEYPSPPPAPALVRAFAAREHSFVLDSAQNNEGLGEWSFFGSDPFEIVEDGLPGLKSRLAGLRTAPHPTIPLVGGAVGYLAYDYGRRLEKLPVLARDDRRLPDAHFGLYDGVAALHHPSGRLFLASSGLHRDDRAVIAALGGVVDSAAEAGGPPQAPGIPAQSWEWNLSEREFLDAVRKVRAYIAAGDVYQVNLSRRASREFSGDPVSLYLALRRGNPAPYGAYLDAGAFQVLSTSPEQFLRKRGHELVTRPIKGTRPRGSSTEETARNAAELEASAKDRAELLMIVDLERNDLGRIAEFGSVRVEGLYQQEHYARVIHQTAQVKARLASGKDVFDAIHALFPGGSITGAPKIRAMQIIEELEPTRRGVYCGSIGYIGFDGNAEFNIAIRSLHLKDGILDYQVGSGIVWDSEPEAEYQETLDKGRAIRETIDEL